MDEIAKKRELNDDEVIAIISKQIKTRKESMAEFEKAGRDDLKNQTQSEIDILMRYMPEQMSEEEVLRVIDQAFETVQPTSMKDMGKLMGVITPQVRGKADMGFVNKMIKERLSAK